MENVLEFGQIAASAAVDKKAGRIALMDVRGLTDLCDVVLICSAENERQTVAVANEIEERCRKVCGIKPHAVEGKTVGNWVLMVTDLCSFIFFRPLLGIITRLIHCGLKRKKYLLMVLSKRCENTGG
jgi:ribosome-associated protein